MLLLVHVLNLRQLKTLALLVDDQANSAYDSDDEQVYVVSHILTLKLGCQSGGSSGLLMINVEKLGKFF